MLLHLGVSRCGQNRCKKDPELLLEAEMFRRWGFLVYRHCIYVSVKHILDCSTTVKSLLFIPSFYKNIFPTGHFSPSIQLYDTKCTRKITSIWFQLFMSPGTTLAEFVGESSLNHCLFDMELTTSNGNVF